MCHFELEKISRPSEFEPEKAEEIVHSLIHISPELDIIPKVDDILFDIPELPPESESEIEEKEELKEVGKMNVTMQTSLNNLQNFPREKSQLNFCVRKIKGSLSTYSKLPTC